MKNEFLIAKPEDFNPSTGQITFNIQLLDEVIKQYIIDIISKDRPVKIKIVRVSDNALRSYEQLQKWFASLESILKYYSMPVTKETRDALHEQLKLSMFDAEYMELGDLSIPLVPSLATMEFQNLSNGIQKLVDRYDFIPEIRHGRKLI